MGKIKIKAPCSCDPVVSNAPEIYSLHFFFSFFLKKEPQLNKNTLISCIFSSTQKVKMLQNYNNK